MKNYQFKQFGRAVGLIALMLVISTCSRNPVTGKKELSFISEQQEISMGKSYDPQVVAQFGKYDDQTIQNFINDKGQMMAKISHRPHLNYEFKVLDSPVINAFAVPGGYVYFTRGILAHFNNEAEFAGVLGHEIGHVTARHTVKQQTKGTLAQLGLVLGMVLSKEFRQFAQQASQATQLLMLKFSRDHETQSDKLGVEYSTKIGYDAAHMANFFKTLARMRGDGGQSIPTFMSTHPDPLNRYEKVQSMAKEWQAKSTNKNFKTNRNQYLRMIDGLIYGEDPRQGYFENNMFYHPTLKFQFPVPADWITVNSPQQLQMASKDKKAMMILTLTQANSLEEASQKVAEQFKLTVTNTQKTKVNGFPALAVMADQPNEQDPTKNLRLMNYFIQYNGLIYTFLGIASQTDFNNYQSYFAGTMKKFNKLTDKSKLNVQPEKIKIQTVQKNMTLEQALRGFRMPEKRFNELAILNSMELTDQVQKGVLIKVVSK